MNSFFLELKRRNVFRIAGAYLVVSWLLVESSGTIAPILGFATWLQSFILYVLLALFPVSLVLAWYFELTPNGIKRTVEVSPDQSITTNTGQKLNYIIIATLMLTIGFMIYDDEKNAELAEDVDLVKSIAVLPFVNMSGDAANEYFSDGMSEEILNSLVKVNGLQVAGRTSSFQYKNKNIDLREVGEALSVNHILEGSVRKSGSRVRITAQLVRSDNGFHIWSETYDRELTDVFAIQDEITKAIVTALRGELVDMGEVEVHDIDAYDLYLRGKQFFASRGYENIEKSFVMFEAATIIDPKFSEAYSSLAEARVVFPFWAENDFDTVENIKLGMAAAEKALELDPNNVEAMLALAGMLLSEGKPNQAFDMITKVEELAHDDAELANFLGDHFRTSFNFEKAFYWEKRALELDPLFFVNFGDVAAVYNMAGDYEAERGYLLRFFELNERDFNGHLNLVINSLNLDMIEQAKAEHDFFEATFASAENNHFYAMILYDMKVAIAVKEGDIERANQYIKMLEGISEEYSIVEQYLVTAYLNVGDVERYAALFREMNEDGSNYTNGATFFLLKENNSYKILFDFLKRQPELKEFTEIRMRNLDKASPEVQALYGHNQ